VNAFVRITSGYVLWPLLAIQSFARFLFAKPAVQKGELESIRSELEKALFATADTNALYAFREAFYRYTGLAQAESETREPLNNSALLNVARNTNRNLRAACISRRDKQKLEVQLRKARQDIFAMMTATNNREIRPVTLSLADYLQDASLANALHSR
jgi:hypothetical protein